MLVKIVINKKQFVSWSLCRFFSRALIILSYHSSPSVPNFNFHPCVSSYNYNKVYSSSHPKFSTSATICFFSLPLSFFFLTKFFTACSPFYERALRKKLGN